MFIVNCLLNIKFNYNWQHCSAISLTVIMLCVCTKRVCVKLTVLVCKSVRLQLSHARPAPFPSLYSYSLDHCYNFETSKAKIWEKLIYSVTSHIRNTKHLVLHHNSCSVTDLKIENIQFIVLLSEIEIYLNKIYRFYFSSF